MRRRNGALSIPAAAESAPSSGIAFQDLLEACDDPDTDEFDMSDKALLGALRRLLR